MAGGWGSARGGGLDTLFGVDPRLHVEVYPHDDEVRGDVQTADAHQDLGVFEGDLFRDLHHPEDDDQVGSGAWTCQLPFRSCLRFVEGASFKMERSHLHLWVDHDGDETLDFRTFGWSEAGEESL